jgi:hypothetical protein
MINLAEWITGHRRWIKSSKSWEPIVCRLKKSTEKDCENFSCHNTFRHRPARELQPNTMQTGRRKNDRDKFSVDRIIDNCSPYRQSFVGSSKVLSWRSANGVFGNWLIP